MQQNNKVMQKNNKIMQKTINYAE